MALPKVATAVRKPAPVAAVEGVNIGDLSMYVAGGGVPEGDYALEFNVQMYQATDKQGATQGPSRLGVMLVLHSLTDPSADPRTQFYSMGTKAHESFAPNPDTGKGVVPVAGSEGGPHTLSQSTNWFFLYKSMRDAGLPENIFTNDFSVLDGMHVHIANVPEPEERKGFQSAATAEVANEPRRSRTIAIVTEIKEDGMPWEGGGGIPEKVAVPAKTAGKPNGKAVAVPKTLAPKVVAKPVVAAPTSEYSEEDLMEAADTGATAVIQKSPNGMTHLLFRTSTFKKVGETFGEAVAQAVMERFFVSDDAANEVLNPLGYVTDGKKVTVQA